MILNGTYGEAQTENRTTAGAAMGFYAGKEQKFPAHNNASQIKNAWRERLGRIPAAPCGYLELGSLRGALGHP
jgi:hypothetical protein